MRVQRLDHLVLTVTDVAATVDFYGRVCGMSHVTYADGERHALGFGDQRINLHVWGAQIEPRAALATPGSADLCLVVDASADEIVAHLDDTGVPIEEGPVQRPGAAGTMTSVYVRDPDRNLVELASYVASADSRDGDAPAGERRQRGTDPRVAVESPRMPGAGTTPRVPATRAGG